MTSNTSLKILSGVLGAVIVAGAAFGSVACGDSSDDEATGGTGAVATGGKPAGGSGGTTPTGGTGNGGTPTGGAGGTPTGGSAGTPAGGTTGGGDPVIPACNSDFSTPASLTDPVVSYLWEGSQSSAKLIEEDGRIGDVVAVPDPDGGGEVTAPIPIVAAEECPLEGLLHLQTIKAGKTFGSLLSHGLTKDGVGEAAMNAKYDASKYFGITFYVAQTSATVLAMSVELGTVSDTGKGADTPAGTCVASAKEKCFDFYAKDFKATKTFTRYDLCWEDLKKVSWAADDVAAGVRPFDPTELLSIQYKAPTSTTGQGSDVYFTRLGFLKSGAVSSVTKKPCAGYTAP